MKLALIIGFSTLFCTYLSPIVKGQAFAEAPKLERKVKEIVEWQRPTLKAKAQVAATSGYDRRGNLIYHYSTETPKTQRNTYRYDSQNRLLEKREYFEGILHHTQYSYRPNLVIAEYTFHDKTYRICDYYKSKNKVERKVFAKGGEMNKSYQLLKRHQYFYHKKGKIKSESKVNYGLKGARKGQEVAEEKIKYHYHPKSGLLNHIEYFNIDNTLRKERFFSYNAKGTLLRTVDYFHLEKEVSTTEYLYKNGVIWQEITEKGDQKSVLVFTGGRPIRLRSYLSGKLQLVVDYGYAYY